MPIVLVRVDDRLIHGQVAVGWTRTVGATHIVVANDEVARDATQKALLKLAAPVGVKVSILSLDEAATLLLGPKVAKDRVMVLVRDPQSLLALMDRGVALTKVNVGTSVQHRGGSGSRRRSPPARRRSRRGKSLTAGVWAWRRCGSPEVR